MHTRIFVPAKVQMACLTVEAGKGWLEGRIGKHRVVYAF